jgi:nucleotide-binding universal stress UspA family protein
MLWAAMERNHARWRTAMTEAITRILVPVDFSAHSEKAVRYAMTLATRFGARVSLLHVVEDPFVTGAWQAEAFVPNIPELLDDLMKAAQAHIAEVKTRAAASGVVPAATVVKGQPAQAIVEEATAGGFDLIVMGTHGRTGLSHAFVGSIAERVMQRAPCAVLTVRETDPAALKHAAA